MNKRQLTVVGLGYVGLPLAVLARQKGWQVTGLDIDEKKVAKINRQESPVVDKEVAAGLKQFPITASTDPAIMADSAVIVVAVPTPVTDSNVPDLTPLTSAVRSILPHLQAGQVLIIESTINPGVMDEAVVPELRKRADLALDADGAEEGLYLIHCPERINPGDPKWTVRNIPRVLGGYSDTGTAKAKEFYESILEAPVTIMASVTEAEAVKILENTFRDVNIAFINEMAKSFDALGIDITHVIAGASTKPFAFMPHYPGNGVGGHCISVDPYYMIERARQVGFDHDFLQLARTINESMPIYTVNLLERGLQQLGLAADKESVALLGLAYKKNIDDLRNSPAATIRKYLEARYSDVRVFEPYVPARSTVASLEAALDRCSAVVIGTDHDEFVQALTADYLKKHGVRLVIDGKNALDGDAIAAAGITYYGIGRSRMPKADAAGKAVSASPLRDLSEGRPARVQNQADGEVGGAAGGS